MAPLSVRRGLSSIAWWLVAIWWAGFATLGQPKSGQPIASFLNAPITVGDLAGFLGAFVLVAGLGKLTARIASRKGGNYIGWAYYGLLVPFIALPHALLKKADLSTLSKSIDEAVIPAGNPKDHTMTGRTKFSLTIAAIVAVALFSWWWTRPAPETLTQRLWRECRDTFVYTHPEWDESHLEHMTKLCMDQRLLGQGAR